MKQKMSPIRRVLLVLTLLLLLWDLLPLGLGIQDPSKWASLLGLLVWLLLILKWPRVKAFLKRCWKKRGGRVLLIILFMLPAALLIVLTVLSGKVLSAMHPPKTEANTVIVLGCQVRGEQPSLLLSHRIDAAADYLKSHPEAVCIVSGGQGSGEAITEAECMLRGLTRRGIEAGRVILETQSTSTMENLQFSMALMEENGLSPPVLIVSNNFHLFRALEMARSLGLEADGLPASCEWYMLPTYIFREALALMKYYVFG